MTDRTIESRMHLHWKFQPDSNREGVLDVKTLKSEIGWNKNSNFFTSLSHKTIRSQQLIKIQQITRNKVRNISFGKPVPVMFIEIPTKPQINPEKSRNSTWKHQIQTINSTELTRSQQKKTENRNWWGRERKETEFDRITSKRKDFLGEFRFGRNCLERSEIPPEKFRSNSCLEIGRWRESLERSRKWNSILRLSKTEIWWTKTLWKTTGF